MAVVPYLLPPLREKVARSAGSGAPESPRPSPTLSREERESGASAAQGPCLNPPRFPILFSSKSAAPMGARGDEPSPDREGSDERAIGRPRGVVTGAGGGIGKAVVHRLLREGARVLAVDAKAEGLAELGSADCETLVADVTDPGVRTEIADWADGARYLVNSAGVIVIKPIFDLTVEDWRPPRRQSTSEATFFLCQKVGPRLASRRRDRQSLVESAKLATTIEAAAYPASKTTILSITRSFANARLPRRVRVSAILPGIVDTATQEEVLVGVATMPWPLGAGME